MQLDFQLPIRFNLQVRARSWCPSSLKPPLQKPDACVALHALLTLWRALKGTSPGLQSLWLRQESVLSCAALGSIVTRHAEEERG